MGGFFGERVFKPLLAALVTFIAIRYITGSATDGALVALIPLVLGAMNVFANIAYAVAAASVIAGVFWAVAPPKSRVAVAASVYRSSGMALPATPAQVVLPAAK